jgi:hypothetical protein
MKDNDDDDDDDDKTNKKPPAPAAPSDYPLRSNDGVEEEEAVVAVTPGAVPVSHQHDRASLKKGGQRRSSDDEQKQTARTDGVGVPQLATALAFAPALDWDNVAVLDDDGGAASTPGSLRLEDRASRTKEKRGRNEGQASNLDKKPAATSNQCGVQLAPGVAPLEEEGAAVVSPGSPRLDRASRTKEKRGRKGRHASNRDDQQAAMIDQGVQLAPGVAPGADTTAVVPRDVEGAPSVPSDDGFSPDTSRDDDGAPPSSPTDHEEHALDAFVVHTKEERLAALSRLTKDAPLAQIVNESSASRQSQDHHTLEERRQKLFWLGGLTLILVLSAILVPLAVLGKLSGPNEAETLVSLANTPTTTITTLKPTGVPSRGPTLVPSGVPSRAPTTPAPTSNEFSLVASLLFANPEQDRPRDPTSPQWKALTWLAEVDSFTRIGFNGTTTLASREQLVQRYVLATLYYATNGDG